MRRAALVALALAAAASAEAAEIAARAEPTEAHVGDEIAFVVDVAFAPGAEFQPPRGAKFEPLALKRYEAVERKDDQGRVVGVAYRYTLAGFEVGEFTLPAVEVTVLEPGADGAEELRSEPIDVKIASVLTEKDTEPRDIAGPVDLMERNRPLLYALAALALLSVGAALGWWLYKRYGGRQRAAAPAEPLDTRSPEQWAFDTLAEDERAWSSGPDDAERCKAHIFAVTETLRAYLGRKFRFESLEMTTEELVAALRARDRLDPAVRAYLDETDYLKFGRARLERPDVEGLLPRTRALVEDVAAREARRAAEAAAARPPSAPATESAGAGAA